MKLTVQYKPNMRIKGRMCKDYSPDETRKCEGDLNMFIGRIKRKIRQNLSQTRLIKKSTDKLTPWDNQKVQRTTKP